MDTKPIQKLEQIVRRRSIAPDQRKQLVDEAFRHLIANSRHINGADFSKISDADLGMLFQITDELFFDGWVARAYEVVASKPLVFRLSTRMTRSGGTTTMFRTGRSHLEFEIAVATTPIFSSFPSTNPGSNQPSLVGGVSCHNRVEALQRIMEHEMIHLSEMLVWGDSNCSARPFKDTVFRLFGHTESNHHLLSPTDIAKRSLGIQPGDYVSFDHHGKQLSGTVNRITKRATVLVPDPNGTPYSDGKRYSTYYVPLVHLKKAS